MVKKSTGADAYYYAGGEKVELARADDLIAIDGADLSTPASLGRALTDGLRLVTKDELSDAAKRAGDTKSKYPVFRSHGSIVVALPEVRVEESRKAQWAHLQRWLKQHGSDVEVVSRGGDRVVLKPVSGSGEDALTIANDLAEKVGLEMAQARFIRVTSHPKP